MPESTTTATTATSAPARDDGKHKIGVLGAISYLVGNIIGSGIFITPSSILKHTGSVGASLIVWAACGLLAMIGALCYVELGTSIRKDGADFAYLCYVEWYPVAFAFLWTNTLIYHPCGVAILVETVGAYIMEAISPLICVTDDAREAPTKIFGFLLLCNYINYANYYYASCASPLVQTVA